MTDIFLSAFTLAIEDDTLLYNVVKKAIPSFFIKYTSGIINNELHTSNSPTYC